MSRFPDSSLPPTVRLPLREMPLDELTQWVLSTRDRLNAHVQWERAYLERRTQQGRHTRTDVMGSEGIAVELELLALLDEMLAEITRQQQVEGDEHAF